MLLQATEFSIWFYVIGIASLTMILVFFFLLFVQFNKKKIIHLREKDMMQRQYEKALMESQLEIQEATFTRISEEIHDNIGQVLSLARLQVNTLGPCADEEKLKSTDELLEKAISDLRSLSHGLNTKHIVETGLSDVIRQLLGYMEKTGKYTTTYVETQEEWEIAEEKQIFLVRMMQEIINNIIKHAEATQVAVVISGAGAHPCFKISDNGKGFVPVSQNEDSMVGGIGIAGLKKRAGMIGATIRFDSAPGKGTSVLIQL